MESGHKSPTTYIKLISFFHPFMFQIRSRLYEKCRYEPHLSFSTNFTLFILQKLHVIKLLHKFHVSTCYATFGYGQ